MSLRFDALKNLGLFSEKIPSDETTKITAIFAENVFTHQVARQFLSDEAFKSLLASIKAGQKIDRSMAAQIANGIRAWAILIWQVKHWSHAVPVDSGCALSACWSQ